jgi:hypothetical protein
MPRSDHLADHLVEWIAGAIGRVLAYVPRKWSVMSGETR